MCAASRRWSITNRPNRRPASSAATQTGADRSGSRSTYLLIESLQKFHHYYGDDFKVECPTGSGQFLTLNEIANELSNRLIKLWLRDGHGERPFTRASGDSLGEAADRERYLFHEYFHGDTGAGLGATHQTGWTGLVAKLIQQQGSRGTIVKLDPFTDL